MPGPIQWNEWRPDVNDLDAALSQVIQNCVPHADGYGPIPSIQELTATLPAQCRGYFFARKVTDNTVVIFAATATKLYMLNNGTLTWTDVSKSGGSYTSVNTDANWTFAQFNNFVFATQLNTVMQRFDITSSTAFADAPGSPPQAAYVATVGPFLVLSCLNGSPATVEWSAIDDTTGWTAGVNDSDSQDLPDGGAVRGVVGGQLGIIFQESCIRRMDFSPGSDVIFNIYRIAQNVGCIAPYSIASTDNTIFFLSQRGWAMIDTQGDLQYIGQEKVDRTFFADYDSGNPQLVIGACDPRYPLYQVIYKSAANSSTFCDKGLVYHQLLQRWAPWSCALEYLCSAVKPGLTEQSLDAIAPGAQVISGAASHGGLIQLTVGSTSGWSTGQYKTITQVVGTTEANGTWQITVIDLTHIDLQGSTFVNAYVSGGIVGGSVDLMTISLDSLSAIITESLSGIDSSHALGLQNGPNLEASFETAEQDSPDGQRLLVGGFRPLTDAPSVFGSIGYRETLNAMRNYTPEMAMDAYGKCNLMRSTRYARARVRIPAGTTWKYSKGVIPEAQPDGYA